MSQPTPPPFPPVQTPHPFPPAPGFGPGLPPAGLAPAARGPQPHLQQVPHPVGGYAPRSSDRNKKLAGTLVFTILAGIGAGLVVLMAAGSGVVPFLLALTPCTAMLAAAATCYLWLDRWEPEPFGFLLLGFLWGGGIATVFALLFHIGLTLAGVDVGDTVGAVVEAPVVEELGKGAFLLFMAFTLRRRELNSLVDFLVYAGFVGLGFAFFEDLLYFASSPDVVSLGIMVVLRLWMGIFAHPLFTSMTAFGLWYGRKKGGAWTVLGPVLGLLGAMLCHGLWNGSASLGLLGFLGVYLVLMVPLFAFTVRTALRSRRAEGATIARQLPGMVGQGLVHPVEAAWLGSLEGRSTRARQARLMAGGKPAGEALTRFTDAVTELAFLRDRLDRGETTPRNLADHQDLINHVAGERQIAMPALAAVAHAPLAPATSTPPPPPQAGRPQ